MKKFFPFFFLVCSLQAFAQRTARNLQTSVQAGVLEGQRGTAFQLQVSSGFQSKTWFAGLGAGLDYYHTRSIPVFLNVRKALFNNKQPPFFYLNGGYHFPWLKEEDKEWYITETKGGLYFDAGIGYQISAMKKAALFFSGGYSHKAFSQKQTDGVWIAIWPGPPSQNTRLHEYTLRRLSIQTGIRF